MKGTALVIMAAGIGSCFGDGVEQLEPTGPGGEIIMDHSIHDATEAGFSKVIFITRGDLEKDLKEIIGHRIKKLLPVECAYQELQGLPTGYEVISERTEPQGTGQVVLSVKGMIDRSLLVTSADDYYGREGFRRIHDHVAERMGSQSEVYDIRMRGPVLPNASGDNSIVTRGACQANRDGSLANVAEAHNTQMKEDGLHATDESGVPVTINPSQPASMNMWRPPVNFIQELEKGLPIFPDSLEGGDIKSEYLLPKIIDSPVQDKKARVIVSDTPDKWFGVTYRGDKQAVTDVIRGLTESGVYERKLSG